MFVSVASQSKNPARCRVERLPAETQAGRNIGRDRGWWDIGRTEKMLAYKEEGHGWVDIGMGLAGGSREAELWQLCEEGHRYSGTPAGYGEGHRYSRTLRVMGIVMDICGTMRVIGIVIDICGTLRVM